MIKQLSKPNHHYKLAFHQSCETVLYSRCLESSHLYKIIQSLVVNDIKVQRLALKIEYRVTPALRNSMIRQCDYMCGRYLLGRKRMNSELTCGEDDELRRKLTGRMHFPRLLRTTDSKSDLMIFCTITLLRSSSRLLSWQTLWSSETREEKQEKAREVYMLICNDTGINYQERKVLISQVHNVWSAIHRIRNPIECLFICHSNDSI